MFVLTDKQLALIIGKLPKRDDKIFWLPEDLPAITIALRALLAFDRHDRFLLDSKTMPHWLYLALVDALSGKELSIKDLEYGPVDVLSLPTQPMGEGLTFRVAEEKDLTLVKFSVGRRVAPEDLSNVVLPAVQRAKGVVIAGNGPPWLTATIGISYARFVPWVAATQKSGGAIVAISRNASMPAGSLIEPNKLDVANKHVSLLTKVKRGDIWWFEDGYEPHPGLVISSDEANERLSHVLIVPMTSSPWKNAGDLVLLPTASVPGLMKDSYALCEHLSKIALKDLGRGQFATIADDIVMQNVIRQIRQVIGDIAA